MQALPVNPTSDVPAPRLRYARDDRPGIRRIRSGSGFRYLKPDGRPVGAKATLARIKSLVIPPAWTAVWISPDPKTHVQATGRDARGRKQYRYHPQWRELSHQTKYSRMLPFARALPRIRQQVRRHLRESSLSKSKVLATVLQLLEKTLIRVGNEEYVRENGSFGLTTLRDRHVKIKGRAIQFEFKGKSGVRQSVTLSDARLARIVKRCQEIAGQELFQYLDDEGARQPITSADVNDYLRAAAGQEFSAKDFRMWAGTVLAARELSGRRLGENKRQTKANLVDAIKAVARQLGNTPAVCRTCYIHPAVLEAYANGTLNERLAHRKKLRGLNDEECAVLALLESRRTFRENLEESLRRAKAA